MWLGKVSAAYWARNWKMLSFVHKVFFENKAKKLLWALSIWYTFKREKRHSDLRERNNFDCLCEGFDLTEAQALQEIKSINAYKEEELNHEELKYATTMSLEMGLADSARTRFLRLGLAPDIPVQQMSISLPAPSDRISSSINPTCGFSRWPLLRLQSPYVAHTADPCPPAHQRKRMSSFFGISRHMSWTKMHSVGVNECPSDCIFWEVW